MTAMNQKRKEISSKGSGGRPQTPDVLVKYSRPIYCGIFPFVPSSHPHFQVLAQTKRPSREESPGVGMTTFSFLNSPLQAGVTESPAGSCGPVWDFKEVPLPLAAGSGGTSALDAEYSQQRPCWVSAAPTPPRQPYPTQLTVLGNPGRGLVLGSSDKSPRYCTGSQESFQCQFCLQPAT